MSNIFGDAENNILGGTSNDDLINGYGGDDELSGGGGNDLLNGGADADTLKGGGGIDTLNGDAGVDNLKGGGGNDVLNGGADNDTLAGGKGSDTLDGGEGNDRYEVTAKDFGTTDTFDDSGTGGEDEIDADKVLQLMLGGDFNALDTGIESIRGDVEDELEIVGDGHAVNWDFTGIDLVNVSQILGSDEDDVITGSDADDKVKGGGGNDELNGGDGDDNLAGGGADDTLTGGDDDDKLKGGGGDDTLTGGAGNDTLTGGSGNDIMDGGEGDDTYVYKLGEIAAGDVVDDTGTSGTDVLDVSALASIQLSDVWNNQDDDIVIIEEFLGNEDTGTEIVAGENAVDWSFEGATMINITQIVGSSEGDSIGGSESDDKIKGGGGDDNLSGENGDDVVKGSGGDDALFGGAGNDTLKGGGGNDTLAYDGGDGVWDGQDDVDTLWVLGVDTLDITELAGTTLKNIEIIDLFDAGNTLVLDGDSAQAMSGTTNLLTINGGESDAVVSIFAWTKDVVSGDYQFYVADPNDEAGALLAVQIGVNVTLLNTTEDDASVLDVNTGAQLDEGGTITITSAMLHAVDPDPEASLNYMITAAPTHGTIFVDGTPYSENDTFSQAEVDAGLVTYQNAGDDGVQDAFSFKLYDGIGNDMMPGSFDLIINADITGTAEGETLYGGAGHDTLDGAGGNDTLNGYAGDDELDGGLGADVLQGGDGDDYMSGNDGLDQLSGGNGNDTLNGDNGNDSLGGGEGDDLLMGGDDNDEYTFIDELGDEVVEAADEGTDIVKIFNFFELAGLTYTLTDNVENAQLLGTFSFNLNGNALDNVLNASSADGDNILDGAGGNDTLFGGSGDDTLIGGNGNDFLSAGTGNDQLDGGAGIDDTADFSAETGDLTVNLVDQSMSGGDPGDSIDGFENFIGGYGNDDITGTDGENEFEGGNGNDTLIGGAGNDDLEGDGGDDTLDGGAGNDELIGAGGVDTINGGTGNDIIQGGAGADILAGGADIDRLDYSDQTVAVTVNLESNSMSGGDATDTISGFENVTGGEGNDFLFGDSATDNMLWGGAGDDELDGGQGNDTLNGGDGVDLLIGAAGNDTLDGGAGEDGLNGGANHDVLNGGDNDDLLSGDLGDDVLYGGAGDDLLNGGNGNDVLFGGSGDDEFFFGTMPAGTTTESIGDFEGAGATGGDVIRLDNAVFIALPGGALAATSFVSSVAAPVALDGDDFILYNSTTGELFYDADGNSAGGAVLITTLTGSPDGLTADDFNIF